MNTTYQVSGAQVDVSEKVQAGNLVVQSRFGWFLARLLLSTKRGDVQKDAWCLCTRLLRHDPHTHIQAEASRGQPV